MSKIEDAIAAEQEAARKRAETKERVSAARESKKWQKWVEEEKPRIAKFKQKVNKAFPCLEGDIKVSPRRTIDYLDGDFTAVVTVRGTQLRLKLLDGKFNLFIPSSGSGTGWQDKYIQYELTSDADLKKRIKEFITQSDYEAQRTREYYDSFPIGNTD